MVRINSMAIAGEMFPSEWCNVSFDLYLLSQVSKLNKVQGDLKKSFAFFEVIIVLSRLDFIGVQRKIGPF